MLGFFGAGAGACAAGAWCAAEGAADGAAGAGAGAAWRGMRLTFDDWRPDDLLPPIGRADNSPIMLKAVSAIIALARNFFIFIESTLTF